MDCVCDLLVGLVKVVVALILILKVYTVLTIGKCKSKTRLDGKVVIVTGANSGIGREASKELLNRGAKVILACRNVRKAIEVANEFQDENPEANVSVKQLDLCDFSSVRSFADEILKEEKKIDILINNAGMSGDTFKITADGFEEIYQANFLGPILLTDLLLPLLKSSAPSRIINTGSLGYLVGNIDPSTFETELKSDFKASGVRYSDTKLAMLMWTRAMGVELENTGVTINVLHPGVVWTRFAGGMVTFENMFTRLILFVFGRSASEGAQTILHLSLDPSGGKENGQYWAECTKQSTWKGNDEKANRTILDVARRVLQDKKQQ